jgi:hypothetical protein
MASLARAQMTLDFDPSLPERWPTLRHFIAYRAALVSKPMKVQAADMDMSPSTLSRKLNPSEGDTQRFNVDDFEQWLESTGDAPAILDYLAAKFMDTPEARRARVLTKVEAMVPELAMLLATLKTTA